MTLALSQPQLEVLDRNGPSPVAGPARLPAQLLPAESDFYGSYSWCLNLFPTVGEAACHLRRELDRLHHVPGDWRLTEVATNVYLLSCALMNAVDDYLFGVSWNLPRRVAALPFARPILAGVKKLAALRRKLPERRARSWKDRWQAVFDEFILALVAGNAPERAVLIAAGDRLAGLLPPALPAGVLGQLVKVPSVFRRHDVTPVDELTLGRRLVATFPDRCQPVVLVGLRTSGSYLVPLLRAYLHTQGYGNVAALTLRPNQGTGAWERAQLARCAGEGALAVLVDDPPGTGDTIAFAVDVLHKNGFGPGQVVALLPMRSAAPDWRSNPATLSLANVQIFCLGPEEWYKQQVLAPARVDNLLQEYFHERHYRHVRIVAGVQDDQVNARMQQTFEEMRGTRLKRLFKVRLETTDGRTETRYVLAKSVGWGWLGYHAFLAGERLAPFVPSVLGLRDGILYTEWLPQTRPAEVRPADRDQWIATAADYVARRATSLRLGLDPSPALARERQHKGIELLARVLGRAYGWGATAVLKRGYLRRLLAGRVCRFPTLIDGRMWLGDWIEGPAHPLKTDFEHHGMGKYELNATDPAYDLAETVLALNLSPAEESRLVARYAQQSGDARVGERLYLNKLLAGTALRAWALEHLDQPQLVHRAREFNQQYVDAWNFLTVHTVRYCGSFCRLPKHLSWHAPLVVLDIDGVLDRRIFGFPSTTEAGIEALSLLHSHGMAVAVNSARSAMEVQEYCRSYGLVGAVAEHGSYLWDAVAGRGRCLVSAESLDQLERLRRALERLPGVFLNTTYEHSLRAYTYEEGVTVAVPTLTMRQLLADLRLDRLCFHQTHIDTAVVAREVDKGTGLAALLKWVGLTDGETIAVGDSEPDLAMFQVARRCFAPAQISCPRQARMLGCQIVERPNQPGLLRIVRSLVHPHRGRCGRCSAGTPIWPRKRNLFVRLLHLADQSKPGLFFRALFDPRSFEALFS